MALYPSIRIEGGILGPDLLDQVRAGELPGQRPADFVAPSAGRSVREPSARYLTDDVARSFADARRLWSIFRYRLNKKRPEGPATSITRDAWVIPFLGLLDYELEYNRRAYNLGGLTFAISHRAGRPEWAPPVHIVGVGQELGRVPASGRPRLSPHALVQEYLNRTEALWGVVTNGDTLRLLRDCANIRRQAYVEFDLPGMLEEQRFDDFQALYRLLHRSRLPRGVDDAPDCRLEQYYQHSLEQGGRIRDRLRDGVEKCIGVLGNGFLRNPANSDLRRRAVSAGSPISDRITAGELYRNLLTLIYRLLFLLVTEDRGLLGRDRLYRDHYGAARLRRLLDRPAAPGTDHDDLWQSLRVLWRVLAADEPVNGGRTMADLIGLPVLNGDLFKPELLDGFTISNRDLLAGFEPLVRYRENESAPPRWVNYAALDVEELGSVYESLLDFRPVVTDEDGLPRFDLVGGPERKSTGSYYTPPELVAELVKSALEPVLKDRLAACSTDEQKERAVLSIRVCDPACGSGHFLLAAARRLGKELASIRTGEEEPAPERVREGVRDVIAHSIYGVDRNPLAVDLCRVALWIESHAADKPLTFLDHRIRCGDSLLGVFDPGVLADGIPNDAFTPVLGDDKAAANALKKRNRAESKRDAGQLGLALWDPAGVIAERAELVRHIDEVANDSPGDIRLKRMLFDERHEDPELMHQRLACDLWTAAFFQPLRAARPAITTSTLADHLAGMDVDPDKLGSALKLREEYRFFHWPLEFPDVFEGSKGSSPGFDVVLANPPWERFKLQEKEFFGSYPGRAAFPIYSSPNAAVRRRRIRRLSREDASPDERALLAGFQAAKRKRALAALFVRKGGRFPLTAKGDVNMYAVFAETCRDLVSPRGACGMILPSGIATDYSTKTFFRAAVGEKRLAGLFDFENRKKVFQEIDSRLKFCLLTLNGAGRPARRAEFAFFLHGAEQLRDPARRFFLSPRDFALFNPNTRTCPVFRTRRDMEIARKMYRRAGVFWKEAADGKPEANPWGVKFSCMFHMANDSGLFRTREQLDAEGWHLEGNVFARDGERYLPLYEAKLFHQYDHRFATFENVAKRSITRGQARAMAPEEKADVEAVALPRYWVPGAEVTRRLENMAIRYTYNEPHITPPPPGRAALHILAELARNLLSGGSQRRPTNGPELLP